MDQVMVAYVMADETGAIVMRGFVPASMLSVQTPPTGGGMAMGDGDPDSSWVTGGAVSPRPANPSTLDGMTLKSLPIPCTVVIEGVDHDCDEDHCELSFSTAGTYSVVVRAFPMLDATFEVTQA